MQNIFQRAVDGAREAVKAADVILDDPKAIYIEHSKKLDAFVASSRIEGGGTAKDPTWGALHTSLLDISNTSAADGARLTLDALKQAGPANENVATLDALFHQNIHAMMQNGQMKEAVQLLQEAVVSRLAIPVDNEDTKIFELVDREDIEKVQQEIKKHLKVLEKNLFVHSTGGTLSNEPGERDLPDGISDGDAESFLNPELLQKDPVRAKLEAKRMLLEGIGKLYEQEISRKNGETPANYPTKDDPGYGQHEGNWQSYFENLNVLGAQDPAAAARSLSNILPYMKSGDPYEGVVWEHLNHYLTKILDQDPNNPHRDLKGVNQILKGLLDNLEEDDPRSDIVRVLAEQNGFDLDKKDEDLKEGVPTPVHGTTARPVVTTPGAAP